MAAIGRDRHEAEALVERDGTFELGQRIQLELAVTKLFRSGDDRRHQRLAHTCTARLRAHEQALDLGHTGGQGLERNAAQKMIAALGQQQLAARRGIDAGQRIQLLRKTLRRQIHRQRRGIGAKQRRHRDQFGGAARRRDQEIAI
jgi:hypothetical protein